ncbi:MAG: tail assembly chaperone [Dorea sp.]
MQLIINDTEYNFRFGIGFVRHLDGESSIRQNGITFGVGSGVYGNKINNERYCSTVRYACSSEHDRVSKSANCRY